MAFFRDLTDHLFPRRCVCCGCRLAPSERDVCLSCLQSLPLTDYDHRGMNPMLQLFAPYQCVSAATASYVYIHRMKVDKMIKTSKFHHRPHIMEQMSYRAAHLLQPTGFFEGIDLLVPVPLSRRRQRERGFNQCDYIVNVISEITGIPVETNAVVRTRNNPRQSSLPRSMRAENVKDLFAVTRPDLLRGRHVLLVDDVITTGSTLDSCVNALLTAVPDLTLTIYALSAVPAVGKVDAF